MIDIKNEYCSFISKPLTQLKLAKHISSKTNGIFMLSLRNESKIRTQASVISVTTVTTTSISTIIVRTTCKLTMSQICTYNTQIKNTSTEPHFFINIHSVYLCMTHVQRKWNYSQIKKMIVPGYLLTKLVWHTVLCTTTLLQ